MVSSRYRCRSCGNLSRFEIDTIRRVRERHNVTAAGKVVVEGAELLDETVDRVLCDWCGHGSDVVQLGLEEQKAHGI